MRGRREMRQASVAGLRAVTQRLTQDGGTSAEVLALTMINKKMIIIMSEL